VSFHTLEHIYPEDAPSVIKEIYRILKPGGFLLISIPYEHNYPDPCHVAFYNEQSLSELMSSCDFVIMEVYKDDHFTQKNLLTGLFYKKSV
jgi:predicted SAM-dependent methyltransferase